MTGPIQIHTIRRNGVWINELHGEGQVPGGHRTKDEASDAGREIAASIGAEHVIHNHDGSVGARANPDRH